MWKSYKQRQRRKRFSALVKYLLVFALGGLVTLAAMPYFTPRVVNRITELQKSVDERVGEWFPATKGRASLLSLADPTRLVEADTPENDAVAGAGNQPRDADALATARADPRKRFTLRNGRTEETKWLNQDKVWEGTGDAKMKFNASKSPWILYWSFGATSELGSTFDIYWTPSDKENNAEYQFSVGTAPVFGSTLGIPLETQRSNYRVIHDNDTSEFTIRASGTSWTVIAATEP